MKAGTRHLIGFSLLSATILGACSVRNDGAGAHARLYRNLLDGLGTGNAEPLYAAAAVQTPQGLWNIYIMSAPPDRLIFRQSRQNAEIEFGMNGKMLWREDMLTGQARALTTEWRYFVRSYELFRLGSQLAGWKIHGFQPACKKINDAHEPGSDLCLVDEFGKLVSIQIDDETLPSAITRELPAQFGGGTSVIVPTAWTPHNGDLLMTGFRQGNGNALFSWDIQSVMQVPDDEILIEAPAGVQ